MLLKDIYGQIELKYKAAHQSHIDAFCCFSICLIPWRNFLIIWASSANARVTINIPLVMEHFTQIDW